MNINKKHFILVFDESVLREGMSYKVYFKNHPNARKMNDCGNGTICLCAAIYSNEIIFVNVSHSLITGELITNICELSCTDVDKYDIDIVLMWDDEQMIRYIKEIKDCKVDWPDCINDKIDESKNPNIINLPDGFNITFPEIAHPLKRKIDIVDRTTNHIDVACYDDPFDNVDKCIVFKKDQYDTGVCVDVNILRYASSPSSGYINLSSNVAELLGLNDEDEVDIVFNKELNNENNTDIVEENEGDV